MINALLKRRVKRRKKRFDERAISQAKSIHEFIGEGDRLVGKKNLRMRLPKWAAINRLVISTG